MSGAVFQSIFARHILVAVLVASAVLGSQAQEKKYTKKDLPAAVLKAFQKEYPKATINNVSMEKEKGAAYWEIESVDGKVKRDLLYSSDGRKAESEETIEMASVPAAVKATLSAEYPKGNVVKAEMAMKGSVMTYEFLVNDDGKSHEVVITPEGKLLMGGKDAKSKDDDDEEEDDDDDDVQG